MEEIRRDPPPETDRDYSREIEMARRAMGTFESPIDRAQKRVNYAREAVGSIEGSNAEETGEGTPTPPSHPHWYIPAMAAAARSLLQQDRRS